MIKHKKASDEKRLHTCTSVQWCTQFHTDMNLHGSAAEPFNKQQQVWTVAAKQLTAASQSSANCDQELLPQLWWSKAHGNMQTCVKRTFELTLTTPETTAVGGDPGWGRS